MNAGGLHGLAKSVSLPPAVAIACLMNGMRYCLSCCDAERFQRRVAVVDVRVAARTRSRSCGCAYVAERVPDAFARIEVGVENLPLLRRRKFRERLGGSIRERAADAEDRLRSLGGIDEDTDLRLERLAHRLECQLAGRGEPVVRLVRGRVDRDLSRLPGLVRWWVGCLGRRLEQRAREALLSQHECRRRGCEEATAIDCHVRMIGVRVSLLHFAPNTRRAASARADSARRGSPVRQRGE